MGHNKKKILYTNSEFSSANLTPTRLYVAMLANILSKRIDNLVLVSSPPFKLLFPLVVVVVVVVVVLEVVVEEEEIVFRTVCFKHSAM